MRVTNGIPLRIPLLLPVDTVNCVQTLKALASTPTTVAIGETGLDFNRDFSPREEQIDWFIRHVQLAVELQKPLFVHEREVRFSGFNR